MSFRIDTNNIYLNNNLIGERVFKEEGVIEFVNIKEEHLTDFYKLKNVDICENLDIYYDEGKYSLNLFKEGNKTFITKDIKLQGFDNLLLKDFSQKVNMELSSSYDSNDSNLLLSVQLDENESVEDAKIRIDLAYNDLINKFIQNMKSSLL